MGAKRIIRAALLIFVFVIVGFPLQGGTLQQAVAAFEAGAYVDAHRLLQPLAVQGRPEAQFYLGMLLDKGKGVREDAAAALHWYRRAARAGYVNAQYLLGLKYARGDGVAPDDARAVEWYRRAAHNRDASAQYALGRMYEQGRGTLADMRRAESLYLQAARQGHVKAQLSLGQLYLGAAGIPADHGRAQHWLEAAADQGNSVARERLQALSIGTDPETLARKQEQGSGGESAGSTDRRSAADPMPSSTGSGFLVTPGAVVTNAHVVSRCRRVRLRLNGRAIPARLQTSDARQDLALLSLSSPVMDSAILRTPASVALGERIYVVGFPLRGFLADDMVITGGEINALAGPYNNRRHMQISAPVQNGNSGGPVLDTAGRVVGVVVSSLNSIDVARQTGDIPQNVNFAIQGHVVAGFLEAQGIAPQISVAEIQAKPSQHIAADARRFTVMVECYN